VITRSLFIIPLPIVTWSNTTTKVERTYVNRTTLRPMLDVLVSRAPRLCLYILGSPNLTLVYCAAHTWLVPMLTRVNSTYVQDEGLRIGGIGCRMNLKVKISQTRRVSRINVVFNLAYSQSIPARPLLAPIYRWSGLKEPVGSDTYYNVYIRHGLILRLWLFLGLA
jgi:hypothetical protein